MPAVCEAKAKVIAKTYLDNGMNARKVVEELFPHVKGQYKDVKAHRLIHNANVQSEIVKGLPSLEQLSNEIQGVKRLCLKDGDYSNFLRACEDHVRMQGGFKDVVSSKITFSVEESEELSALRRDMDASR